jgi:nitrate/TMAO reductase-like tetraheme cytochrome c subunit
MMIRNEGRPYAAGWRLVLAALAVWLFASGVAAEEAPTGCETCHSDKKYFFEYQKLYRYYQDWLTSPHKKGGVTCDDCHGGDPLAHDKDTAHQGILPVSDTRSALFYRNQPDSCGECHKRQATQFKESAHYKGLKGQIGTPTCTTCHAAMNRRPYYRDLVENTCRVCHYENNPDGLPMVANQANQILHRLNVAKGYMNWTRTHYQFRGWPDDSKDLVDAMSREYDAIITQGHTFDLENTDQASIELLTKLKDIYHRTADELEERSK